MAGLAAQPPDLLDDAGRVGDRLGVGHRVHGREAAHRGRHGAGLDRLGVLAAGLAQVRVQVDEPGQQHHAGAVHDFVVEPVESSPVAPPVVELVETLATTPSRTSTSVGSPSRIAAPVIR